MMMSEAVAMADRVLLIEEGKIASMSPSIFHDRGGPDRPDWPNWKQVLNR